MTDYSASVTADFSGYTSSTQQAIALTKEFTAANEGMVGMIGRTGTRAILAFNEAMGLQGKMLKANVSEAANYQQMLGRVSASAKAAGKDVGDAQRLTMSVARSLTGNISSAESVINSVISSGETRNKQINATAKAMVNLGAATGESGVALADNIRTLQRAYGYMPDARRITALGDSVVSTSRKFGASATAVTEFSSAISPFAKQVGLASTSLVGFSTAFARVGEDGYRSANVFSKVLTDIDSAVREGSPTLGTYAETMGLTYKEAEKLAKSNPAEFLIRFTEGLDKQGSSAIRTLEALGLEGVRSQKALSALTASGDLRGIIKEAQTSYGSGVTSEAAQEQLKGLNEQSAKLEESLRQVVAGSGAPFLGWLEKVASVSTKAADGLAGVVNSSGFQAIAGGAVGAMAIGGLGAKALGASYAAGSIGSFLPMVAGPMGRATSFIGRNRGMIAGTGAAGLVGGAMMGNQSMSTLGMGALAASSLVGTGMFGKARTASEFLFRDAATLGRVPFTQWGESRGRDWRMANLERSGPGGLFRATGSQDQLASIVKYMKAQPAVFDKAAIKDFKEIMTLRDSRGRTFGADELARLNDRLASGRIDPGRVTDAMSRVGSAAPTQTAGMRAMGAGRMAGTYLGGLAMMVPTQTAALVGTMATNPIGWGVAATAAVGAGALYVNKRGDARDEAMRSTVLTETEGVAAAFGLIAPKFEGLARSTEAVAGSFDELSAILTTTNEITASQYATVDSSGKPSVELDLQNRRVGWQTVGSQRQSASTTAELLAAYGTLDDGQWKAALVTDFKKMGKTDEEVNMALADMAKARGGNQGVLAVAMDSIKESDDAFLQSMFSGLRDTTGQDLIKRWAADNKGTMSNEAMGGEIVKAISAASPGMTGQELTTLIDEVWKTAGLEDYDKPNIQSNLQYNKDDRSNEDLTPEQLAAANEGAVASWMNKYVAPGMTNMEATMKSSFMGGPQEAGSMAQAMDRAAKGLGDLERMNANPDGKDIETAKRYGQVQTQAEASELAKAFTDAVASYKEGSTAQNIMGGQAIAAGALAYTGGSTAEAASQLRQMQFTQTADSPQGKVTAGALAEVQYQQGLEAMGMTDWAQVQTQLGEAASKYQEAKKFLTENENSPQAQAQFAEADTQMKEAYTASISYMQNYLKAKRQMQTQMRYADEDYQESVAYAGEDFRINQERAQEQFDTQQKYARQDFYISMRQMAEDYATSMARSERDYLKQRTRTYEDHDKAMVRRAEDAAKAMYSPFQRITLEQTWSGGGLLTNLQQQQEAFDKQISNLEGARKAGVDQKTLDMLGLNDPAKAQQLERLMRDIASGSVDVGALNKVARQRQDAAGVLFGEENDVGVRRQEEDYRKQLERMSEDRNTWLKDAQADYNKARRRANEAFSRSMERAQEGFDRSMRYMEESQALSLSRMEKAHEKQMERAQESFEMTFEAMTSNYEALAEATSRSLKDETVEWNDIVRSGLEDMETTFEDGATGIDGVLSKALDQTMRDKYGANGDVVKSWKILLEMLNAAGGDGGNPLDWPGDIDPGAGGGSRYITGGKGRMSNPYGTRNSEYSAGYHTGTDIAAPTGTPIFSPVSGKVVLAKRYGAYGNAVIVDDANSDRRMLFGHMSSIGTREGATVHRGSGLGRVGSTGNSSGPHLHFEVRHPPWRYGDDVSPYAYMWQGGITQGRKAMVGENVYPEAVIPLNERGVDVLAKVFDKAFGQALLNRALTGGGQMMRTSITTITEDHSVNINGPVSVVSQDPERVGRELERKARDLAIIQPNRRP